MSKKQKSIFDHQASQKAVEKTLSATCQFLVFKKNTKELPVSNGCGVLFQHNANHYCLSNAHVIADAEIGKTFVLGNNQRITFGGQYYYTRMPSSNRRTDDPFDIGIVKLQEGNIQPLKDRGYSFINLSDVITGHELLKNEILWIAGFPGSKTTIDHTNNLVKGMPMLVRTVPFLGQLKNPGFPSTFHFFAKYPINKLRNSLTGNIERAPKPQGISGSGLWLFDPTVMPYEVRLIGILSEYLENRALVVSTKIDLFIDIIRQKFDPSIPNFGVTVELLD
jgi:hypothetical protein